MIQRSPVGALLVTVGVVLVIAGLLVWSGALSWFGRLPGDIRVERPGFRFYAPWVSMLILSLILTLLLSFLRRFWD
jgi:membrane protein implicated in regulation of membrane protease activity